MVDNFWICDRCKDLYGEEMFCKEIGGEKVCEDCVNDE